MSANDVILILDAMQMSNSFLYIIFDILILCEGLILCNMHIKVNMSISGHTIYIYITYWYRIYYDINN